MAIGIVRDGHFLCGCAPADKIGYLHSDSSHDGQRRDSQGFIICPEHGERMYGWKSDDPKQPHYEKQDSGVPPLFVSPAKVRPVVRLNEEDVRDNRDPEEVYLEMRRERAQLTNGHA